jgi:hypothetical protein
VFIGCLHAINLRLHALMRTGVVLHAFHDIKPRLCTRGVVANPRDATGHRCGLRLATSANPSVF